MNRRKQDYIWNTLGSTMAALNTVLMTMIVGHKFDIGTVGTFTFSLTTSQILYAFALFGANDQQMIDYRGRYSLIEYGLVKVYSTVLTIICAIFIIQTLGFGKEATEFTVWLTGFMLINSLSELFASELFRKGRVDLSGKTIFWRYFVSTCAFAAGEFITGSIIIACAVMFFSDNVVVSYWTIRTFKEVGREEFKLSFSRKQIWNTDRKKIARSLFYRRTADRARILFSETAPLCLCQLGMLVIVNCPKYLINLLLTPEYQGVYSLLFMPVYAVNLLGQCVFRPFFATFARWAVSDKEAFRMGANRCALICFGGGLAAGAGIWLLGPEMISLLFGQNIKVYRGLMAVFAMTGGILVFNQLLYYLMVILQKRNILFRVYMAGTMVSVSVGFMAIKYAGLPGTWIGFTMGQVVLLAGMYGSIMRMTGK